MPPHSIVKPYIYVRPETLGSELLLGLYLKFQGRDLKDRNVVKNVVEEEFSFNYTVII